MADDPKPARPRTTHGPSHEPEEAPITANTPLPPLNPLPLPAEDDTEVQPWPSAAGGPTPDPLAEKMAGQSGGSLAERTVDSLWAVGTLFLMMIASLILLAVLASVAATVSKSALVPVIAMIIIVLANLFYAWVVLRQGQALSQGRFTLRFPSRRRGS